MPSSAENLKAIAKECDDMAEIAHTEAARARHRALAEAYRRMAAAEEWLTKQATSEIKASKETSEKGQT